MWFEIMKILHNMQLNHYLKVKMFYFFIVIAPSVVTALEQSTSEKIDWEAERAEIADFLQEFDQLCKGEIALPANIQKELKCRYTDHGNPFLKLAPFKEEEAYLKPRIVIFHDVISNEEIEILKKLAQQQIKLGEVKADEERIQAGRLSQRFSIWKNKHEIANVLNRRIEHMTRLSVANADPLEVCYYKIGGLFVQHYDFHPQVGEALLVNGNRIATVLFYMNDVEEGGKTVFPELNVSLTPKRGSAAFWYNLLPNGIGDPLTLHAGCPVIAGSKWVTNVCIKEAGQEFIRPCTLENEPVVD